VIVELPEPFDFDLSTERFRAFGTDPATLWEDGRLHRVFDETEARMSAAPQGVVVEPSDPRLAPHVERFLGAGHDLDGFARHAAGDRVLADVAAALRGLRPPLIPDPFEMLVGSITAQQVSLRAATAIRARLVRRFGRPVGRVFAFPARDRLAAAAADELTELGFSRRKAEYVLTLARSDLDLRSLVVLPDDEVKRALTAHPGLGEWTADWFLARHLGRSDAWPAGDLGLRKAVAAFYHDGRVLSTDEVRAFGERFSPFRNLAAQYLLVGLRVLPG
jgi:DNA-3-methyladenine glycosylase II